MSDKRDFIALRIGIGKAAWRGHVAHRVPVQELISVAWAEISQGSPWLDAQFGGPCPECPALDDILDSRAKT